MPDFKAKMQPNPISTGAPPQTPLGSLQRSQYPLAVFKGATSKEGWWRSTVVERRSLAGELSLSCARPAADG